jgi:thymidylate synthase
VISFDRAQTFYQVCRNIHLKFVRDEGKPAVARTWQGLDVTERPEMIAHELYDVSIELGIRDTVEDWAAQVKPNLPWAEEHFQERISGIPLNPPPSNENWPYAKAANKEFKKGKKFSHTYPERFWPKKAKTYWGQDGQGIMREWPMRGIRFDYGDLADVVDLLSRDPYTRQAYLPVWFPEDTGVHHGERVPCTLGYHLRWRHGTLDIVYYIRSCDFRRHFADDVYMAGRLAQWVAERMEERGHYTRVGNLVMHISSLHVFAGDLPIMKQEHNGTIASAF